MTVAELIAALARCHADDLVFVPAGHGLAGVGEIDASRHAARERGGAVLGLVARDKMPAEQFGALMRERCAVEGSVEVRGVVVLWPTLRGGMSHG